MSSYKSNINVTGKEYDQNNKTIFIASNIEYITTVSYVIGRQIVILQIIMAFPRCLCHFIYPFLQS